MFEDENAEHVSSLLIFLDLHGVNTSFNVLLLTRVIYGRLKPRIFIAYTSEVKRDRLPYRFMHVLQ